MVKAKASGTLNVLMNGRLVGFWYQSRTGATTFKYAKEWLATPGARPLSLSLPLRSKVYEGQQVYNFFDNLLPDSKAIRDRMQTRFQTSTNQPFDLLSAVGSDCVGAVQLCHELPGPNVKTVTEQALTEAEIAELLRNYRISPLGMSKEVEDFRISIAGAQEKTALLWHKQKWCLPTGPTPTSHIFKLPIGVIPNNNIDLSESCENEWLCLKIAEAFGLPVAKADIQTFEDIKVLVVERFDRKWSRDGTWLMRLPQEDMCQVFGVASSNKYQADGGPGIAEIMKILIGSNQPQVDREQFFKTQILFWLLAAIDGHAKNFSVYLDPNASYRLTPLYDVLSAYPSMKTKEMPKQKAKMAMALKGKKNRYEWSQIQLRHFLSTAKAASYSQKQAIFLLLDMLEKAEFIAQQTQEQLSQDFPTHISEPILEGMASLARQHLPALYQLIANYADEGDYESATAFYKKAINLKTEIGDEQGKVELLNCIANLYNAQNDIDHAIEYYTQSLDIAAQYNDLHSKATTLYALADIYKIQGRFEHALALYEQALSIETQNKNWQDKTQILWQIADIFESQGYIQESVSNLQEALSIYEKQQDLKGQSNILHQIANIYAHQRKSLKALLIYEKIQAIDEQIGDLIDQASTLHQIANVYVNEGENEKALEYYEESLKLHEQEQNLQGKAINLHCIAGVYAKQKRYREAISYFEGSLKLKKQIGDWKGELATFHQVAKIHAERGEIEKAHLLYLECLKIEEINNDLRSKADTLHSMALLHIQQGRVEEALSYFEKSLTLSEQVQNLQGKAVTLTMKGQLLANYLCDFEKAIHCLQESLDILRELESSDVENVKSILIHVQKMAQAEKC